MNLDFMILQVSIPPTILVTALAVSLPRLPTGMLKQQTLEANERT